MQKIDVAIIGSGPNGLAAAVALARCGLSVHVYEAEPTIGGGARTAELTLPGFRHDVCSAVHPQAVASPFFRSFELERRVRFVTPPAAYAHPLDGDAAGIAWCDLDRTVDGLGADGPAWRRLFSPMLRHLDGIVDLTGGALLRAPRDPQGALAFGLRLAEQGTVLGAARFRGETAPAMLAGVAAHSGARLPSPSSAGVGLVLGAHAHARGWPIPVGGSQAIVDALADDLRAHGGTIETGIRIADAAQIGDARAVVFDTSPRTLLRIAGDRLPDAYRRRLARFRYGAAVAKVDFATDAPIPWARPEVAEAAAVHLGGTRVEIARAERIVASGRHAKQPYVLLSQPTLFDPTRAPEGKHVVWAYAHVPRGSALDATEVVTRQIERFAPGFRDTVLASSAMSAVQVAEHNANNVGGEISGGAITVRQLLARPVLSGDPWRTPAAGIYLCSASASPGPSVHGMNGWWAALSVLRHEFGIRTPPDLSPES